MRSTTTARSNEDNEWNPHQFKEGDRIISPTGEEVSIETIGVKYCVDTNNQVWLMKRCKPLAGGEAIDVQQTLFGEA